MLESAGVSLYGGIYGSGSTAELPELSPSVRAPMEDRECLTVIDLGGNDAGARILRQFGKYFTSDEHALMVVVNPCRPETATAESAAAHIASVEGALGMSAAGIVGNAHLLRHTTAQTVLEGERFCQSVSAMTGIPLLCECYPAPLLGEEQLTACRAPLMPVGMYMTESWQDR